ncbi:lysylphosphatidylglycerol synthase transmembrane domain-containing protein [Leptospira santarosai]|uniref:lysylphosphatidylglycerol synthase transmembrane domain-containing protein n=1 Tax=Leptospira santarosai TaxID=28183 RepID=UPI000969FCF2|nr:lysylphosphatidylglycerol synthase transmembrane domain-containing protein [Leptospira santarosai]MDI7172394.1 lysylphosphatidylglycerol synthase transmembrane domain-containing protein [Leptospira santarosai]MDI7192424.1 lysylphosphatidylglycerol synthase transmembrane domain-containing protein [Leptospira santarosai]MDO6383470.1 lysylphosphatidylglycerol synthase transmembrane domain-containing protein [Leptospira santarosai]MDO6396447.1 lysylphosphatidylglycerol synthase transmembrane dom
MKRILFGTVVSVVALGFLFSKLDLSEFAKIRERWDPIYLIPFCISSAWGLLLFSWRWYLLMGKQIRFRYALLSSFIGVGANMFLPARGGDIFRLYFCKKESSLQYPTLVTALFIEKVLDFSFIFSAGICALMFLGIKDESSDSFFIVSSLAIVGIFLSLIAVRFLNETIVSILSRIAGLFGKKEWFDHKLAHYVRDLGNFLVLKRFILPAFLTSLTWLIGYALSYGILLKLVGIPMNYSGIVLIMFAGAVGVMIPSAPSGAGVFHASVTSSFVLMGRKASEGLFYATTVHLAQFILQSVFAVILYLYWIVDRKKRGLGKAEFSLKESEVIEVEAAE